MVKWPKERFDVIFAGCIKQGVNIPGKDIDSVDATNADDCAKHCDSLPKCKAYVFNPSDNKCRRKHSLSAEDPYPGRWAGKKDCSINNTNGN